MAASTPFLFIVATNPSGFRKSSTQKLIRTHASKSANKARRASFAIDRHNPRQIPRDIAQSQHQADHGIFPSKRKAQPQHKLTDSHLDETPNSNADGEDIGCPEKVSGFVDSIGASPQISRKRENTPLICQLGSNSSVLNRVCPVGLDLTTQFLLHRLLDRSVSNKFVGYREAWLPVVLSDGAAFQQFLSTFALHLQRTDPSLIPKLNVSKLLLQSRSLQSVNRRLRSSNFSTDEGLLAAVISFIAHNQAQERYDLWEVHIRGLQDIIKAHGGLERAFLNKPRLRILLFFITLHGSWVHDLPSHFPPPHDLLPCIRDLPTSPSILVSFHHATQAAKTWREIFPDKLSLPDVLDDLIILTAHLASESIRTKGASWTDSITTGLRVNPLIHRLHELRLNRSHRLERGDLLQEVFRIAALLFLKQTKWHTLFVLSLVESLIKKLKSWLCETDENDWIGFEALKSWALVMGAINSGNNSAERLWFELEILHMARLIECANMADILGMVKSVLWIAELFDEPAEILWKELRMIFRR